MALGEAGTGTESSGTPRKRVPRWLAFVLTIAALELFLRLVLGNYASSGIRNIEECTLKPNSEITYTGWLLRIPGVVQSVNEHGYRGEAVPHEKPDGTLRILMVGDSFLFGQGVADDATIPAQLERRLGAALDRPVEVLNFGIEGLNIEEVGTRYSDFASGWEHDLLLYVMCSNDLADPGCDAPAPIFTVFRNVYVIRLPVVVMLMTAFVFQSTLGEPAPPQEPRLGEGLKRLRNAARANGSRFGVVVISNASTEGDAWMKAVRFPVLDVNPILTAPGNTIPLEGHLSVQGCGAVANRVGEWLMTDSAWAGLL